MSKFKFVLGLFLALSSIEANASLTARDKAELGIPTNYITNGGVESGLAGWKTYKDAAGVAPVDATGGSPSHITISASTSSPIGGAASLVVTNSGSSTAQGEGVSYDFTVNEKATAFQISFDYVLSSGTFVAASGTTPSDLVVYVYDVTNGAIIQPTAYTLACSSTALSCPFKGTFQTASNSTSYRLALHTASTNTSAWAMKLDNFSVSRQGAVYGVPGTDWTSCTATGSWVSNTTYAAQCRRDGGDLYEKVKLTLSGAPTSANLTINLPSGLTIDTTKLNAAAQYKNEVVSTGNAYDDSAGSALVLKALYNSSTSVNVGYQSSTAGLYNLVTQAAPITFANLDQLEITFQVPIVGWSSNVLMSNDSDPRPISLSVSGTTTTINNTGSGQTVIFPTVEKDTTGTYNSSTGVYTVAVPGDYTLCEYLLSGSVAWTAGNQIIGQYQINSGTVTEVSRNVISASVTQVLGTAGCKNIVLKSADTLKIVGFSTVSNALTVGTFSLSKIGGNQSIASVGDINARYDSTSGANITSSLQVVDFATKKKDSHGLVSGAGSGMGGSWKFTTQTPGFYCVSETMTLAAASSAAGSFKVYLYKSGSQDGAFKWDSQAPTGGNSTFRTSSGTVCTQLLATDYLDIRASNDATIAQTTGVGENTVSIVRVGN